MATSSALLDAHRPGMLPDNAAEIFRDICNDAEDASDLAHAAQQNTIHERLDVQRATMEVEHFKRQPKANLDDRAYRAMLGTLERARRDRVAGQQRSEAKSGRAGRLSLLRNNIDGWLGSNHDRVIVPHAHPMPKLGKGESPADAVNRCRQAVQEMRRERTKVASAPVPSAEAKAAARVFVAETAAQARPDVSHLLAGVALVSYPALAELPVMPVVNADFGMIGSGARVRDGLALACWLTPDAVIDALDREIEATADDKRAMSAEAKAARLAELDAALLTIERDEAAFVGMAISQGGSLDHRPDVDPRALLMVEVADADGVLPM